MSPGPSVSAEGPDARLSLPEAWPVTLVSPAPAPSGTRRGKLITVVGRGGWAPN